MPTLEQYSDQWGNFTAGAQEAVSGGQFVKAMSSMAAGTKRPDQVLDVLLANASGDEKVAVGIATNNAASGEKVTVATRGLFKVTALGTCVAGNAVMAGADENVPESVKPVDCIEVGSANPVGTALNDAESGEKVFVMLNACGGA